MYFVDFIIHFIDILKLILTFGESKINAEKRIVTLAKYENNILLQTKENNPYNTCNGFCSVVL